MKRKHDIESLMISVLYDEASNEEKKELEHLLDSDPSRLLEFDQMKKTIQSVSRNISVSDPGELYWDSTWDRFQDRLAAEEQNYQESKTNPAWYMFWKPAMQIGLVAAMLIFGVFIGKQLTMPGTGQDIRAEQAATAPVIPDDDPLIQEIARNKQDMIQNVAQDSLNTSGRIIDGFMQLDPAKEHVRESGWIVDNRDDIVNLIDNIHSLRVYQDNTANNEISPLLDEIELLVSEIASVPIDDIEDFRFEIQMLQEGIKRKKILERIRTAFPDNRQPVFRR